MATWKQLTTSKGNAVHVNLDRIAYLRPDDRRKTTLVVFVGNGTVTLDVKERPNEIIEAES